MSAERAAKAVAAVLLAGVAYQVYIASARRAGGLLALPKTAPSLDDAVSPQIDLAIESMLASLTPPHNPSTAPGGAESEGFDWLSGLLVNVPGAAPIVAAQKGFEAIAGEPRGIRNHNPGNIKRGDNWRGMAAEQTDETFVQFAAPVWGFRAMGVILRGYVINHGLRTVRQISDRWTATDKAAHARTIAQHAGLGLDDLIPQSHWIAVAQGIVVAENGKQPYPLSTIEEGLRMGGLI